LAKFTCNLAWQHPNLYTWTCGRSERYNWHPPNWLERCTGISGPHVQFLPGTCCIFHNCSLVLINVYKFPLGTFHQNPSTTFCQAAWSMWQYLTYPLVHWKVVGTYSNTPTLCPCPYPYTYRNLPATWYREKINLNFRHWSMRNVHMAGTCMRRLAQGMLISSFICARVIYLLRDYSKLVKYIVAKREYYK
jgi:hypothetical protein